MYESFYGFKEKPFSLLPDPKFLVMSKKHSIALSLLEYSLTEQAGITVLAGRIGCGKTTLVTHILEKQKEIHRIAYLGNTHKSMGNLIRWVLQAFGLGAVVGDDTELYQKFCDFLEQVHASGKKAVLIVDEAQNLEMESLEQLRLLSNINSGNRQLLQLILVGQPELRDVLRAPQLEQFAQRVTMDYFIEPLTREEVHVYVSHRLKLAGGNPELFSKPALNRIAFYSRGIPRLINIVCDTALIYGFAEQMQEIDGDTIREVAKDRLGGQILPIQAEGPAKLA